VLSALLVLATSAASEDEPSKVAFYVLGGLLAAFGVALGGLGITRHADFPATKAASRGIIGVAALLVVGAMLSAVLTA
jgi:hypothetical protein